MGAWAEELGLTSGRAKEAELKAAGVSEVIYYCVNDGAVMGAWAEELGLTGGIMSVYADPTGEATRGLGLVMSDKRPVAVLGNRRCKRFALLVVDGDIKAVNVAASKDDPAGDDKPDIVLVEKLLEDIAKMKEKEDPTKTKVKVGDALPAIELDKGFPPEKFAIAEYCKGKKVVLVGLPGAFTPT